MISRSDVKISRKDAMIRKGAKSIVYNKMLLALKTLNVFILIYQFLFPIYRVLKTLSAPLCASLRHYGKLLLGKHFVTQYLSKLIIWLNTEKKQEKKLRSPCTK